MDKSTVTVAQQIAQAAIALQGQRTGEITHENGGSAMLVLTRKQLRSVAVGGPNGCHLMLSVTVREIQGGSLRLALEVNTDSPVHRCEARERIRASGQSDCPTGLAAEGAGGQ